MNTFRGVFVEVLCHSFNFINMRFVVKVIFLGTYFSLLNSTTRFTFMERLVQNFITSFLPLTYVSLDELIIFFLLQKKIFSLV